MLGIANHCEGLARTGLPIGHDADVEAVETRCDEVLDLLGHCILSL